LIQLKRELKISKAVFYERHKDESKKYELDAAATLDPEIRKTEDKISEREVKLAILSGVIQGYVKVQEGSSREMTRRKDDRASGGD
jgi:hypothetical protein